MKLLLDTCTFLWIYADAKELSSTARELFLSPKNLVYLSSVSSWEILIKNKLGKLPLPENPIDFIRNGRLFHRIETIPLTEAATWRLNEIPDFHKDPFDRILICQTIEHKMTLLTPDPLIHQYPIKVVWQ
jgi:PIN domain nuclease of toxin-antitoxin system